MGKSNSMNMLEGMMKYWKLPKDQIQKEAEIIFNNIDTDHNGYIEYEEFFYYCVSLFRKKCSKLF